MEDRERIAVLESKMEQFDDLVKEVRLLREEVTKYKGFIGGIVFVCSCLFYFLYYTRDWFLKKFGAS